MAKEELQKIAEAIDSLDTTSEVQIALNQDDYYIFHSMLIALQRIADALEKIKEEA